MSSYYGGEIVNFKFIFSSDGDFYDPISIDPNWTTRNGDATPYYGSGQNDILIYLIRGEAGGGGIADGPFSYNAQSATPDYGVSIYSQFDTNEDIRIQLEDHYITRESEGIYDFSYKIPEKLFPGKYTLVLETNVNETREIRELSFFVKDSINSGPILVQEKKIIDNIAYLTTVKPHNLKAGEIITISEVDNIIDGVHTVHSIANANTVCVYIENPDIDKTNVIPTGMIFRDKSSSPVVVASQPNVFGSASSTAVFQALQPFATNSVLLIGHADSSTLQINQLKRIQSIKDAIDTLNGNTKSPLLRAVIDCYNAGCQDIFIMISAPMSEYVEDPTLLNQTMSSLVSTKSATPSNLNFYEKYHERLEDTYEIAKVLDFIDIVVPVGVSFVRCGTVNFVRQLADFCSTFYKDSSTMVIGIVGSRTNGMNSQDIETMSNKDFVNNLLKDENGNAAEEKDIDGNILDIGRHIMLYYGEATFNYPNMGLTYTSSIASAIAGQLSNWPVYLGLNRKVLKGAHSAFGVPLTSFQVAKLHNNKINTLIKSNRSRRAIPFQVLISEDKTLAKDGSSLANIPQVRLMAMIMNEILSIASSVTGKFAYDTVRERTEGMFRTLKNLSPSIVKDYRFEMYADKKERGKVYIEVDIISPNSLKKISFGIVAGPGA